MTTEQKNILYFVGAIIAQVIVLFAIIFFNASILQSGNELRLTAVPVDPADFMRGEYAHLGFSISRLESSYFADPSLVYAGDTVYVPVIQSGNDVYISGLITKYLPPTENIRSGVTYLKATVVDGGAEPINQQGLVGVGQKYPYPNNYRMVTLKYGFEDVFMQEGKANIPFNSVTVMTIKVDQDGNARKDKLYVNGAEWPPKN